MSIISGIIIKKNNFEKFRKLWKHSSIKELNNFLHVFGRKQTLTATLNNYWANFRGEKIQVIGDISTPTLIFWGKDEMAIGIEAVENNYQYMKGDYSFLTLEGGHWLTQTNYTEIETAIIKHITK